MLNQVHFGDCRATMRDLKARGLRVQMCVTSPPYFGLRDYGHAGQLGLEKTPAEYVAALVEVFEGVRELLADDGVLWLNLGDSYASSGGATPGKRSDGIGQAEACEGLRRVGRGHGMKYKDLVGAPWRVAFALQEAGWYLRQDIIWHKPNPMPESVTDRCTKAHEYLFLLSKSERYYFDADAIKEPSTQRAPGNKSHKHTTAYEDGDCTVRTKAGLMTYSQRQRSKRAEVIPAQSVGTPRPDRKESEHDVEMRNRRSVWTVATRPYSGAHFAVFPPALIEPCILAGSRPGDIVLDPFIGSGTTAQVALRHGRQWVGCELNQEYEPLQLDRIYGPAYREFFDL